MKKRFAIITPTAIGANLGRCLFSVRAQSCNDYVHLVVGDGPQDHPVRDVCHEYGASLYELPQKMGGFGYAARNVALDLIEREKLADYVVFCDDDNILFPNILRGLDAAARVRADPPLLRMKLMYHSKFSPGMWRMLPMTPVPVQGAWDILNVCFRADILSGIRFDDDYTHDIRVISAANERAKGVMVDADEIAGCHF